MGEYHHLIPQTYLKSWGHKSSYVMNNDPVLLIYDKDTGEFKNNYSIKNNFGKTNYHSIVASKPICNNDDCRQIYNSMLTKYNVKYNGNIVADAKELNGIFTYFSDWIITVNGELISEQERNKLRDAILNQAVNDIEKLLNEKYERKWNAALNIIKQNTYGKNGEIDEFLNGFLMKFVVLMNFRSISGNDTFNSVTSMLVDNVLELNKIRIPEYDKLKSYLNTASDEVKNELFINNLRRFLNDDGVIYNDIAKDYIRNCSIVFGIASGKKKFITSDNPSFILKDCEYISKTSSNSMTHIFPICPDILLMLCKRQNSKYYVQPMKDEEVRKANQSILNNCGKIVIISSKNDIS